MFGRLRPWMLVGIALLGILALVGEARAKHFGLNGQEDFSEIARRGFYETITNGGTYQQNPAVDATASALSPQPPGYNTYLNRQRNSYTWGSGWFGGFYYVGTVRDVGCFLIDSTDPLCPHTDANGDGSPEPGADQKAEIWRFTPSPTNAATGGWTRALQSPCIVAGGGIGVSACQGFPTLGVAANLPRDIGYRGMTVGAVGPLDTTQRLWVAAFGLGGRVLQSTTGTTFNVASTNGLATIPSITSLTGLSSLQNIATVDLGYRSILIWQGRLCIAPAGSYADEDLPVNPVVLCNSNPASTSSTWQTIVNVKAHLTLGDPNNLGIFQMGVFNGDLYIGVSNRTTGVQIWRLPASQCPIPSSSSTLCVANSSQWQRVITHGGGRSIPSDGLPDSAGVSAMQVHNGGSGDALYIGTSDSAAFQNSRTELFRINLDGTWDLIVGSPRQKSMMDAMNADLTLAHFNCVATVNTNRTQFDFDGSGPNPAEAACFPLGNMAAGFGTGFSGGTAPVTGGYSSGPFGYVWRMAVHNDGSTDPSTSGNFLYLGMLHTGGGNFGGSSNNPAGFDLLKSKDGVTWNTAANTVNNNGLGNSDNYGVRTLVSVPNWPNAGPGGSGTGPALLVGTANPSTEDATEPNTGGAEVHLGTCAPTSTPVAVAVATTKSTAPGQVIFDTTNNRYVAFDDELAPAAGDTNVNVTLVGSASSDTFCGDLLSYQWYDKLGNLIGPASPLDPGNPISGAPPIVSGSASGSTPSGGPKLTIGNLTLTLPTSTDTTDYTFRLCVTDETSQTACADVTVRASHNLPPTAAITPDPPTTFGGVCGGNSGSPRVCLVDLDGNLSETFTVQGVCSDPEHPAPSAPLFSTPPASCVWSADAGVGITFAGGSIGSTGGPDDDPDSAGTAYTVTVPVSTSGGGGGFNTPSVYLTATDDHGYTNQARTRVRVLAAVHDVAVTAIAPTTTLATVGSSQTVTVTVANNGHFTESVNVALVASPGGAVSSTTPQPVSIGPCVNTTTHVPLSPCPTTTVSFNWTPASPAGQPHTLTATAATVTGETNTADNSRSLSVAMVNNTPTANAPISPTTTNEDTSVGITLTGSDPDSDPLTFLVGTGPTHGSLSGTAPNLTYTPAANYNGSDSFTFTVNDGSLTSSPATVSITINAVNDAPSFTKGANQTILPTAGAQTVINWATNIAPGPATATDESGQTLNFNIVSNTNAAIFSVLPAISSTGTLTYTPSGTTGTATVGVQLHDDGGGTAPNVDTSATQTFTITVSTPCSGSICAPTGVTAAMNTPPARQVRVNWNDNATNETRYEVQRCRLSFGFCSYSTVTTSLAAGTTSYNNTVSSAGTYRFRVRACNSSGCSAYGVSNNIAVP